MAVIYILGVRGIPNRYGGFERLVEILAPHLARAGHDVTVFCEQGKGSAISIDMWNGVRRVFVPVRIGGPLATILYDLRGFLAARPPGVALIFGYGTAVFQLLLLFMGVRHAVNMDGIEWQRAKWSTTAKLWLRLNEWIAARLSDVLIADHPEIQASLKRRFNVDAAMIAYGASPDPALPAELAVMPALATYTDGQYYLIIARPEPENQIRLMLQAYTDSGSSVPMLVIGNFTSTAYGRALCAAFPAVKFAGPVYHAGVLDLLRARCLFYLHGHSVGGTNPSLVEAMAAGGAVLAHDNAFNRWVLGEAGRYFKTVADLATLLRTGMPEPARAEMARAAVQRYHDAFEWHSILAAYDDVVAALLVSARK